MGGVGSPKICGRRSPGARMGLQQPIPAENRKLAPSAAGTQYYHTGLGKVGLIKGGEGGERGEKGGVFGRLLQPQGRGGGGAGTKRVWGKESTFATVSSLCFLGDGAVGGGASSQSGPNDPHGISRHLAHR